MRWLWILGGLGGVALVAGVFSSGAPSLTPGSWYKVKARAISSQRSALSQSQAGAELLLLGFGIVSSAVQDPLDGSNFYFVAQWKGPGTKILAPPSGIISRLNVLSWQATDAPPSSIEAAPTNTIDPGLPSDDLHALVFALRNETNVSNLRSFGQSFLPEFPVSASILLFMADQREYASKFGHLLSPQDRARLNALQAAGIGPNPLSPALSLSVAALSQVSGPGTFWFTGLEKTRDHRLGTTFGSVFGFDIPVVDDVTGYVTDKLQWAYDNLGGYVALLGGAYGFLVWEGITAANVVFRITKGKSLDDALTTGLAAQVKQMGHAMQIAAAVLSFVPIVGQIAAPLLELGAGLCLGEDMSTIAINVATGVIPGGAAAQLAFRTGATVGASLAKGEKIGAAALDGLREDVRAYGGDSAVILYDAGVHKAQGDSWEEVALQAAHDAIREYAGDDAARAFDLAVAVFNGQSLQEAGFSVLYRLCLGDGPLARSQYFSQMLSIANTFPQRPVRDVLLDTLSDEVGIGSIPTDQIQAELKPALQKILNDKETDPLKQLVNLDTTDLAKKLGVRPSIAEGAQACVRQIVVSTNKTSPVNAGQAPGTVAAAITAITAATDVKIIIVVDRAITQRLLPDTSKPIGQGALGLMDAIETTTLLSSLANPSAIPLAIQRLQRAQDFNLPTANLAVYNVLRAIADGQREKWKTYYRKIELSGANVRQQELGTSVNAGPTGSQVAQSAFGPNQPNPAFPGLGTTPNLPGI